MFFMNVEVTRALRADKVLIQRLMEFYQYDFSEFDGTEVDEHGVYGYDYLDNYWTQPEHYPFLVRVNHQLAGFVLVNDYVVLPGNTRSISEFFVMRKYRRQGVGQRVASTIFDQLPGNWEVRQIHQNRIAQIFWRRIIAEYTHGEYIEIVLDSDEWTGIVQSFNNAAPAPSQA